jgi:hypothetical protein
MEYDPTLGWDLALSIQLLLTAAFIILLYRIIRISKNDARAGGPEYRSVAILVLGDIGRSPRMMYHAQSFASLNFQTYIIAYKGALALWVQKGGIDTCANRVQTSPFVAIYVSC